MKRFRDLALIGAAFAAFGLRTVGAGMLAQVPQISPPGTSPYGVIAGRALAPDGRAVPDVRVAAVAAGDPIPGRASSFIAVAITDMDGRYRLLNLPPGEYRILAGTTWYPDPGVLSVKAGAVRDGLDIVQTPGFAVRGRLAIAPVLPHSPPVTVRLWADAYSSDNDRATEGMMMETALRPDFTFEFLNVPPGVHGLTASISFPRRRVSGRPVPPPNPTVTVAGRDVDGVELGAGMPGVRVTGRLLGHQPPAAKLPDLVVSANGAAEVQEMRTPVNPDGTFEFLRLPLTSAVSLRVTLPGVRGPQFAATTLNPGNRDLTGVEIPMPLIAAVPGEVLVEGLAAAPQPPDSPTATQILFMQAGPGSRPDPRLPMFLEVAVAGSIRWRTKTPVGGVFELQLLEGRYDIVARNVPDGFRVQSMTAGNTDLVTDPLEIRADRLPEPIRIVLAPTASRQSGPISGQILNGDGTPAISVAVAIVPAEPANLQMLKGAIAGVMQTDSAGRYRFDRISPGRYIVAAGLPVFSGETAEPPVLAGPVTFFPGVSERGTATIVTIGSGVETEVTFRLSLPTSAGPLFSAAGKIVGMTAADITIGRAREQQQGPWPGRTNLQVFFYSIAGTGPLPPALGGNSVAAGCGAAPVQRGGGAPGGSDLHYEGQGNVATDGRYEVRNLPAGRYRACLVGGSFSGSRFVDDIRIGPASPADIDFRR